MRQLGDAETERLRLERWRHAAHRDGFAEMNAQGGARAALRAGFDELGLEEVVSFVSTQNERSIAVTRRLIKVFAIAAPGS